jgi:hypothetical protein
MPIRPLTPVPPHAGQPRPRWSVAPAGSPKKPAGLRLGDVRLAARLAHAARQPLGDDADRGRGDEERLDPHLVQPRERDRRAAGVERREDEVPGQRRLDRRVRGVLVARFAGQQHVGMLTQEGAENRGERQPDVRVHLDLRHARQVVLDRIPGRRDVHLRVVDLGERRVQRGRRSPIRSGR